MKETNETKRSQIYLDNENELWWRNKVGTDDLFSKFPAPAISPLDITDFGAGFIAHPRDRIPYAFVPISPIDLDQVEVNSNLGLSYLMSFVGGFWETPFSFGSARPDIDFCVSANQFEFEFLLRVAQGNETTPFILSDKSFDRAIIFDFDVEFCAAISIDQQELSDVFGSLKIWNDSSKRTFLDLHSGNTNHGDILNAFFH